MPANICGAAWWRPRLLAWPRGRNHTLAFCFGALIGKSCAVFPVGPDPSNPAARVPPVTYRPVISPYTSVRPAQPSLAQPRSVKPEKGHVHGGSP